MLGLGRPSVWTPLSRAGALPAQQVYLLSTVRTDLSPLGPTAFGPCSRVLIGGAQPYMVGGPPSHSVIKEGGGRGTQYEVHRATSLPTDIS
jgi:hypothetical protein